jgi:hypothetical protein
MANNSLVGSGLLARLLPVARVCRPGRCQRCRGQVKCKARSSAARSAASHPTAPAPILAAVHPKPPVRHSQIRSCDALLLMAGIQAFQRAPQSSNWAFPVMVCSSVDRNVDEDTSPCPRWISPRWAVRCPPRTTRISDRGQGFPLRGTAVGNATCAVLWGRVLDWRRRSVSVSEEGGEGGGGGGAG